MELYIGIDWDRKKSVCVFEEPKRRKLIHRNVLPDPVSVRAYLDEVRDRFADCDVIRVAIESGSERWPRLFHECGADVHVIDGKQARRFAESLSSSGAKDDRRDAIVMLQMAKSPQHRREVWTPMRGTVGRLDRLCRAHDALNKNVSRSGNRLRARMAELFPELSGLLPNLKSRWCRRLLRVAPTPRHGRRLSRAAFERAVKGLAREKRPVVWDVLRNSWDCLDDAEAETEALVLHALLDQFDAAVESLHRIEKALSDVSEDNESCMHLRTVDGIGVQLSVVLVLACFQDIGSLNNRDSAAIQCGAAPVARHSGQQSRPTVHMRRSAPARNRRAAYLLGVQAIRRVPWAQAMYRDGLKKGKKPSTAVRRVSRALLRILSAMLRTGTDYDDARYVAALKAKGVPWAEGLPTETPMAKAS